MFEEHLNELKRMLMMEDNFHKIYTYFFDHLGESLDFIRSGKREKNPDLKKILQAIGESALNEKVMVTRLVLTRVPEQRFYHGGCQLNGRMTTAFFFREIGMGMAAILRPDTTHGMLFVRFTTFESPSKQLTLKGFSGPTLH